MRTLATLTLTAFAAAPALAQDGLTLFQPFSGTTASLVDGSGNVVHTWPGTASPGLAVYLLPDGDMLRTQALSGVPSGGGGGLERRSYSGQIEWQFTFFDSFMTPHHDIEVLPNGNILMVVWERVGSAAAIAAGRNPATAGSSFTPDAIYEIQETGPTSGQVVWEWHTLDHVVQDFDGTKPNFGVVADHPELVDINYGPSGDWMHVNGIDYHPGFDQIVISVPNFDEIWVIDHSTTTVEAAGHTGGNSGKGGDLLYRWGNPLVYDRGTVADRQFYFIHDVQWIEPGRPGEGNLIVFNNGNSRPTGDWSSVDEWVPPVDAMGNYTINPGVSYGPADSVWEYSDPGNFYSNIMSGCERLPNGNTLICEATAGRMFEVTDASAITWEYVNPGPGLNWVFKARRFADCDDNSIFDGEDIVAGAPDSNGDGVLDVCEPPFNYCTALANSTGVPASMGWSGSTSLAANDLDLIATDCVANMPGLFVLSSGQGMNLVGDGRFCLSMPAVRLPIINVDGAGTAMFSIDNQNLPAATPMLTAGTTLNFTFWFRDPSGGPAGFNFADGLSVTFSN